MPSDAPEKVCEVGFVAKWRIERRARRYDELMSIQEKGGGCGGRWRIRTSDLVDVNDAL